MSIKINTVIKAATCPHGGSPGSCPLCSGMGGGAAASKADFKRSTGGMSWNECYYIGVMLKAAQANSELSKTAQENNLMQSALFNKIALQALQMVNALKSFVLQIPGAQTVVKVANKIANLANKMMKVANMPLSKLGALISKNFNKLKSQFIDISDKLAAIFGEKELAVKKFLSEAVEQTKKKVFEFFAFLNESTKYSENEDEVEKIKKRELNFKKIKENMIKIFKKSKEQK